MGCLRIVSRVCIGNWEVHLAALVLLSNYIHVAVSQPCQDEDALHQAANLPPNWPCPWNNGRIPFVFNFYSVSVKRLINVIKRGVDFIEARSCLKFIELNPIKAAQMKNFTYLFFTYSGVLEHCCIPIWKKPVGRRVHIRKDRCPFVWSKILVAFYETQSKGLCESTLAATKLVFHTRPVVHCYVQLMTLITPLCSLPGEVAHVILHSLGMEHDFDAKGSFSDIKAEQVLFPVNCPHTRENKKRFDKRKLYLGKLHQQSVVQTNQKDEFFI